MNLVNIECTALFDSLQWSNYRSAWHGGAAYNCEIKEGTDTVSLPPDNGWMRLFLSFCPYLRQTSINYYYGGESRCRKVLSAKYLAASIPILLPICRFLVSNSFFFKFLFWIKKECSTLKQCLLISNWMPSYRVGVHYPVTLICYPKDPSSIFFFYFHSCRYKSWICSDIAGSYG